MIANLAARILSAPKFESLESYDIVETELEDTAPKHNSFEGKSKDKKSYLN